MRQYVKRRTGSGTLHAGAASSPAGGVGDPPDGAEAARIRSTAVDLSAAARTRGGAESDDRREMTTRHGRG